MVWRNLAEQSEELNYPWQLASYWRVINQINQINHVPGLDICYLLAAGA